MLGTVEDRADFMRLSHDLWFNSIMQGRFRLTGFDWSPEMEAYIENCRERWEFDAVRDLFADAARALNDYNWHAWLPVSDDFIVFAYDYESTDDPEPYILKCAPKRKIDLWRKLGWFS